MKRIIPILICVFALCACLTGCGSKAPTHILLEGGSLSFSESTERLSVRELETKLLEIEVANSGQTLFESVTITENTGIFYNSYRFMATVRQQHLYGKLKLTVNMSGKPSGVRNGITEGNQVIFPLEDFSQPIELVAEFEENNTGVILAIIAVLVVIMAAFVFIVKRGGKGYGNY